MVHAGAEVLASVMQRNCVTTTGRADGPVVLFAHGFGCDQGMWAQVVPEFTDTYRVILFDHVGAGRSDSTAYDRDKYQSLDGYAEDLLQICHEMDLHDVILVAHSVSAMMAVAAATKEPQRFARLVLVAPSPCYIDDADAGYVGGFTRADIDGLLESLERNYFAWAATMAPMVMGNPDDPQLGEQLTGSFCRTDPAIARDFARVTFLSDSRALLTHVRTPALVLQCSDDVLAPAEVGQYVHQHLAGSTLVQLAASGHCPHVSAPQETATAILDYLRRSP